MTENEKEEPENEKMKILLSFYPEFKIRQLSDHTGTMFLSNEYDLFIDVNDNPGKWSAQRKRGALRTDLLLRGGRVPKEDVDKADALIKRYNEGLVTHVMEVEERDKGMITNDLEVLRLKGKRSRQTPAPADPEEVQPQPEEPNLDEIQEAPADPEGEEGVQERPISQEEIREMREQARRRAWNPILSPDERYQAAMVSGFDTDEFETFLESLEDLAKKKAGKAQPGEEKVLPEWDEKDKALENKIQEIRENNKEQTTINEVYINKNGKGYSWRITARAADMETAISAALEADKRLQDLKKGDGDNES